uniref:Uncharacterized protein n=1 Tax=Arundo donax TaxID=35708 RepID=A0A0A9FQ40_ARUDO
MKTEGSTWLSIYHNCGNEFLGNYVVGSFLRLQGNILICIRRTDSHSRKTLKSTKNCRPLIKKL